MLSLVIYREKEAWCGLDKTIIERISFEIAQINKLISVYADILDRRDKEAPGLVEITALGGVLHSFYTGLENIFLNIAKRIDKQIPTGAEWHHDLLNQMTQAELYRNPVLSEALAERIDQYLGFRHLFRHAYTFIMRWDEMEKLVTTLPEIWKQVQEQLVVFLDGLQENDDLAAKK